VIAEQG